MSSHSTVLLTAPNLYKLTPSVTVRWDRDESPHLSAHLVWVKFMEMCGECRNPNWGKDTIEHRA